MRLRVLTCLFIISCVLWGSCNQSISFQGQIDAAENLLSIDPDSAFSLLEDIDSDNLPELELCQYTYVRTRVYLKKMMLVPWLEEMHQSAVTYEKHAHPIDKLRAGNYYYYSALAYSDAKNYPAAIVDLLRCVEILKNTEPSKRLYYAYLGLAKRYNEQMMQEEQAFYSREMLRTARALQDSALMLTSLEMVIISNYKDWPIDTTRVYATERLKMAKALANDTEIYKSYSLLAFVNERKDSIDVASLYADSVLMYNIDSYPMQILGMVRQKQGRIAEAVEYFMLGYPTADLSGKYWMGQYLNEIAKTEPGYEYLSSYADSVIYYNQKYDREEQSDNIQQAISAYYEQKKSEQYHQMLKSLGVAVATVAILLLILYVVKTIRTKRHIEHLQQLLQEEKAKMLVADEVTDPAERLRQRQRSLKLHCELFATTEVYRDLQLLYELKTGQVVKAEKRDELVSLVLAGFYEPIRPMLESGQFSHEDLFLCLMTYMKFHSREIAACLGVSDDAVRQRKRRIRSKLNAGEFDMFFTE